MPKGDELIAALHMHELHPDFEYVTEKARVLPGNRAVVNRTDYESWEPNPYASPMFGPENPHVTMVPYSNLPVVRVRRAKTTTTSIEALDALAKAHEVHPDVEFASVVVPHEEFNRFTEYTGDAHPNLVVEDQCVDWAKKNRPEWSINTYHHADGGYTLTAKNVTIRLMRSCVAEDTAHA